MPDKVISQIVAIKMVSKIHSTLYLWYIKRSIKRKIADARSKDQTRIDIKEEEIILDLIELLFFIFFLFTI